VGLRKTVRRRPWSWERHRWSQPTTADVAYRRAGGRWHRNAEQQLAKAIRRNRLLGMMYDPTNPLGLAGRGRQTKAARELSADLSDPWGLDRDRDGIACESNRAPRDLVPVPRR
jgi:hypothetical protein